ncbi:MAG: C10 family peptidase, partial [Muribaculaceae bacterium]|nr:C10 family peptidase [Muribaculaceae bacterium]
YILLSACLVNLHAASASVLSPQEAFSRLSTVKNMKSVASISPVLLKTVENDGRAAIYIFRANANTLIVSADDQATPLLGYFDGTYDADNYPPAFNSWLETISEEIVSYSDRLKNRVRGDKDDFEPISPLCATKWNQLTPYNDLCPVDKGGELCVTGCVATSMAQVMKYHNWPESGEGSVEYTWPSNRRYLSIDFSNQSYDWANMLDIYREGEYSEIEGYAVANLMKSCGYSVTMNYSPEGSGASALYIGHAFGEYFKYDKSKIRYLMRDYFTLSQWEKIIYESLKTCGPVILDGVSNEGGHSFVCDGYDSGGYFHINWGWGGISDGYFLLSALDPDVQGTGGSGDDSGFNYMQDAIVDLVPARDIDNGVYSWIGKMYGIGEFGIDESKKYKIADEIIENLCPDGIYNYGPADIPEDLEIGLMFRSNSTGLSYIESVVTEETLEVGYGFRDFEMPLPQYLPDGSYRLTMAYRSLSYSGWRDQKIETMNPGSPNEGGEKTQTDNGSDGWIDIPFPEGRISAYNAYVANGEISFEASSWNPSGIEDIMSGQTERYRYFNLQGIEIEKPQTGEIVIVRNGNKTCKIRF